MEMMDRLERRIYVADLLRNARQYVLDARECRLEGERYYAVTSLIGAASQRRTAYNLMRIEHYVNTGVLPPSVIGE